MAASDPVAVVRSYLASFAGRDPDAIAAHVSQDFVNRHTSALGTSCDGRDAYRERLAGFLDSLPGLAYEPERLVVAGDAHVAAFYTLTAMWKGSRPVTVRGVQHLVVVDSEIVSRTDYWDSAVFLAQAEPDAARGLRSLGLVVD